MAMITKEVDQLLVKVSCRSVLPQLQNVLKQRLKEPYLSMFKESCFGPLMDVADIQFLGQLVAQLLFCQNKLPSLDKLVFHVQGQEAVMGHLEFALITGLCFGTYVSTPNRSKFYEHVFGVRPHGIRFDDVEAEFKRFSDLENEGETTLNLAMLYVLYGVLLCQRHSKKLDDKYIYLMDDLDSFNNYPWGRVAFEFLMLRTHKCMKELLFKRKERRTEKSEVHGFVQALQVWAYEALPCVAGVCATMYESNIFPRLLRWKTCPIFVGKVVKLKVSSIQTREEQLEKFGSGFCLTGGDGELLGISDLDLWRRFRF